MSFQQFIEEMIKIQESLLNYVYYEDKLEENYHNLTNLFDKTNIREKRYELKSLLHLISKISENHHRGTNFFGKIEQILKLFKEEMAKNYTNIELFNIFKGNKRVLLFLIEENIIIMDKRIIRKIANYEYSKKKYPEYFHSEIKPFINEEWFPKFKEIKPYIYENIWVKDIEKEIPENFYEKRKIGENDDFVCQLIQKDLIEEFIIYINKNSYSIKTRIRNESIYETNSFLFESYPSLIEYAAFFGSIQIFNYLRLNGVELTKSLWLYAIHGQNPEIIHILEENNIEFDNPQIIFLESIKCHHNDMANYFQSNYLADTKEDSNNTLFKSLKYYNFIFLQDAVFDENLFYHFCKYDYYFLAFTLLKEIDININMVKIFKLFFFNEIKKENAYFHEIHISLISI